MQSELNRLRTMRRALLLGVVAVTAVSAVAEAQAAIFLARRVIGRVEQMSQQSPQTGGAGFDSASVILEAPADRVYATAVQALRRATDKGISITKEDAAGLQVQFTNGQQIAGIMVARLGEKLSQILVTSAHTGSQPNAAALVSDGILRVCREMNVECSRGQQ